MKIREIVLGLAHPAAPTALAIEPHSTGVTIVPLPPDLPSPELIAKAIRETIAAPERSALTTDIPFLRVTLEKDDLELTIADDAARGERVLAESRSGGAALLFEASRTREREADRDVSLEAILARIALAAGAEDEGLLLAALAGRGAQAVGAALSAEELAYVESLRRASRLARSIRALDDRMTASVVPDWLWIATSLGGVGVFMTVIALLYPHLRVAIVAFLGVLSLIGFSAYALRALRELKTRSLLLAERGELKVRRDEARSVTRARAEGLRVRGLDPEEVSSRLLGVLPDVPAIVGKRSIPPNGDALLAAAASLSGQTIVLTNESSLSAAVDPRSVKWPQPIASIT